MLSFLRASQALGIACALASLLVCHVFAAEDVGIAVTVRNEVTGKLQTQTLKVDNGSNVFGTEVVRTGPDSSAKIVLKDNTNLNVGPGSSVTLDNFVFKGDADYKQAGFNLAKGAFRFSSGGSDKRAYDLKTPVATIGVRGTDFVVIVKNKNSHIEVSDGQTVICPSKAPANQPVLPISPDKKSCKRHAQYGDESTAPEYLPSKKDGPSEATGAACCRKGCAEVGQGQAVDVTESCLYAAEFTGVTVGENPVSFAQAQAMGAAGGLSMEALAVAATAAAAAAGGAVAGSDPGGNNNSQCPSGC